MLREDIFDLDDLYFRVALNPCSRNVFGGEVATFHSSDSIKDTDYIATQI